MTIRRTSPEVSTVTLTTANTEYEFKFPMDTKKVKIQARTAVDVKVGTANGSVNGASPSGPYFTMKSGTVLTEEDLDFSGIVYLANASAGTIVEILTWSSNRQS